MTSDKLKRSRSDTSVSSSTNRPDRIKRLRAIHHFASSENLQGTIEDNRPKVTDASRQQDLNSLLEKAKPELSDKAKLALKTVENYLGNSENKPSNDEYKKAIKKALKKLSPETLEDYENYGIEFVLDEKKSYPTAKKNAEGNWELNLPTKYEYPIQGMILRCFDEILKVEFENAKDHVQGLKTQTEITTRKMLERRVEIITRVFQVNMMLGKEYGWKIEGYELAEKYHQDYNNGIRRAFEIGLVNQDTPKWLLRRIGNIYAKKKLLDSIGPGEGVPAIFPSMQPGAYFEEFNIKERTIGHKNPPKTFRAKEPIKLGTPEFNTLMYELSSRKEGEDTTLNAVIMPDKTIWVQPIHFQDGAISQHSIIARGNPCVWAGEIEMDKDNDKVVKKMKDKSGHYKPVCFDEEVQKRLENFVLQVFKEQGYDVLSSVELMMKHPG